MRSIRAKSVERALEGLTFLPDRRPDSTGTDASFCLLDSYRDGAIFLAHFAGNSEWERHPRGEEIVQILAGETTLFLLLDGEERPHALRAGELLVIPQNTWHRFVSPGGVKMMTVTPQPTDHSVEWPEKRGD